MVYGNLPVGISFASRSVQRLRAEIMDKKIGNTSGNYQRHLHHHHVYQQSPANSTRDQRGSSAN
jgi:hypothetical protein